MILIDYGLIAIITIIIKFVDHQMITANNSSITRLSVKHQRPEFRCSSKRRRQQL